MFKQFRLSAAEKIQKGIDVMLNLGMSLNHPDDGHVLEQLSGRLTALFWTGERGRKVLF